MLKITTQIEKGVMTFGLEGKLAGPWVKELELCWRSAATIQRTNPVRVDLSSVTFIDADGEDLLSRIYREGAELVAKGCLNKCIVEGIMRSEEKGRYEDARLWGGRSEAMTLLRSMERIERIRKAF